MRRHDCKQTFKLKQQNRFSTGKCRALTGSALIVCLIFLSVVSSLALTALEAAWSGQRMTSAYISYQQTLLGLERELQLVERATWHQIKNVGMSEFLLSTQNDQGNATASIIKDDVSWIDTGFAGLQCGPLFEITALLSDQAGGQAGLRVHWDVCCENPDSCLANEFTQQRRRQSRWRQTDSAGL